MIFFAPTGCGPAPVVAVAVDPREKTKMELLRSAETRDPGEREDDLTRRWSLPRCPRLPARTRPTDYGLAGINLSEVVTRAFGA